MDQGDEPRSLRSCLRAAERRAVNLGLPIHLFGSGKPKFAPLFTFAQVSGKCSFVDGLRCSVIAGLQELNALAAQIAGTLNLRPPAKTAFRQPLGGQPESLTVVHPILIDAARLLRNTNKQPENGSVLSLARHSCASESMPFGNRQLPPPPGFASAA